MEINQFHNDVKGVIPTADVVEGRLGILTTHVHTYDFGSREDLMGWRVPATAEEAKFARYIITWAVDNRPFPLFQPVPSFTWALRRGGWDQSQSIPFSATVYITNPGNQEDLTISSGTPALAFGEGVYTLLSGNYVDDPNITTVGALIQVANTAEDTSNAGKPKYLSAYGDRKVGIVRYYDTATGKLTIELTY